MHYLKFAFRYLEHSLVSCFWLDHCNPLA